MRTYARSAGWNFASTELRPSFRAVDTPASASGAQPDPLLPLRHRRPDRAALPAFARLLRLCRGGDRPLRPVGGRLDGAGPHPALPPLGNFGPRFRAAAAAA